MEEFVKEIIKNKTRCFFVSPHLDDAVLSAGGLVSRLAEKVPVTVVNVFTEATDDRPSLSARQFLKYSGRIPPTPFNKGGENTASSLFAERRKEDAAALRLMGLSPVNLGYVEALWRRRKGRLANWLGDHVLPEFGYVYPVYRFLVTSGHVARGDDPVKEELGDKLKDLIELDSRLHGNDRDGNTLVKINYLVFAPLGVGGHVDHWLVREVCEEFFGEKLVYWSDFPYNVRRGSFGVCPRHYRQVNLEIHMKEKERLIRMYASQVNGLFEGGSVPKHEEVFFVKEH